MNTFLIILVSMVMMDKSNVVLQILVVDDEMPGRVWVAPSEYLFTLQRIIMGRHLRTFDKGTVLFLKRH